MHGKVETTKTLEFRSKLGFKQYDIIITKEESVKKNVIDAFPNEYHCNIIFLEREIDMYFPNHKLAIEIEYNMTH